MDGAEGHGITLPQNEHCAHISLLLLYVLCPQWNPMKHHSLLTVLNHNGAVTSTGCSMSRYGWITAPPPSPQPLSRLASHVDTGC